MWSKGGSRRARSGDNAGRRTRCWWGRGAQPRWDEASPPWQGRRRVAVYPGIDIDPPAGTPSSIWPRRGMFGCVRKGTSEGSGRDVHCERCVSLLEMTKKRTALLSRWYGPMQKEAKLSLKCCGKVLSFWFERNCERFLPWKRLQNSVHIKKL